MKRGTKLYFYKNEIEEWLKEGRRAAITELDEKAKNILLKNYNSILLMRQNR
jgi:hypothetical protein